MSSEQPLAAPHQSTEAQPTQAQATQAQATQAQATQPQATQAQAIAPPGPGWIQRLSSVLFILFCFELGLFLLIYPWTDGWTDNYFAWIVPGSVQTNWHEFWDNTWVRGAISGLGIVNIWIAMQEVFRLFARRQQARS